MLQSRVGGKLDAVGDACRICDEVLHAKSEVVGREAWRNEARVHAAPLTTPPPRDVGHYDQDGRLGFNYTVTIVLFSSLGVQSANNS
jgi:hypothetical protein